MKPWHQAVGFQPFRFEQYYVNATGLSDIATFPDGSVWVGEGQYKCRCGCLLGLPVLYGIAAHPNQFTVKLMHPAPPPNEEDRDDYEDTCLMPPCDGGPSGGGSSGGSTPYDDALDVPTGESEGSMEIHQVCEVTDWYIDGVFTHTTINSCWYELHPAHS